MIYDGNSRFEYHKDHIRRMHEYDGDTDEIVIEDNFWERYVLNEYYKNLYKDTLHRDDIVIKDRAFSIYHMTVNEGARKHELHL